MIFDGDEKWRFSAVCEACDPSAHYRRYARVNVLYDRSLTSLTNGGFPLFLKLDDG